MTILACIPTRDWVVLAADQAGTRGGEIVRMESKIVVADRLPVAVTASGIGRLWHPKYREWRDVNIILANAMAQIPREGVAWTLAEFVVGLAKSHAHLVTATAQTPEARGAMETPNLRVYLAGRGTADAMMMAFDLLLAPGREPEIRRLTAPTIKPPATLDERALAELPSWLPLKQLLESAEALDRPAPPRKVARLVRKLLTESIAAERAAGDHTEIGGDIDAAIVDSNGVGWVVD